MAKIQKRKNKIVLFPHAKQTGRLKIRNQQKQNKIKKKTIGTADLFPEEKKEDVIQKFV